MKASVGAGIALGSTHDPLVGNELGIRDWLWVGNTDLPANAFNFAVHRWYPIDIRVKRRLETEDALILSRSTRPVKPAWTSRSTCASSSWGKCRASFGAFSTDLPSARPLAYASAHGR